MGNIKEEEWVLDMGCGTGLLTRAIEQKTKRVVGLDLTLRMNGWELWGSLIVNNK